MNKRKLQEFASWAKQNLEKQIELSLKKIGINSDKDIKHAKVQGDILIIDGIETSFNKQFHHQRKEIIAIINKDGYKHSIEQFASTWFNRIIALRFLEVHDYLDHGFKIFPSKSNPIPEVLTKLTLVKDELDIDIDYCNNLSSLGKNEELYRYFIFKQCNALAKPLPMLFSSEFSYLEHFIPTPLLFGETLINRLIEIDEDDFREDVEIIGWLYQYYVSFLREETRKKKQTSQNDIPVLSQIFTPNWIVKYMVENSVGRIWLESYPKSSLKPELRYYVDEAKQEESVEKELKNAQYHNVNPKDIKIIEPCSGSGHILTYCFDLLYKMYSEKGYSIKDIPALILKHNLVGLDIDKRATQLAAFALVMRARSIDNKFFDIERNVRPIVYEIIDSKRILDSLYDSKKYLSILNDYNNKQWRGDTELTNDDIKTIEYVVNLFEDSKIIGSLLKVKPGEYLSIRNKLLVNLREKTQRDVFTSEFFDREFKDILKLLRLAHFMSMKYDVMVTNPPYVGISDLENNPKEYLKRNYPNSKVDMFSMFMEAPFVVKNGFKALVNPDSWMFLKSFEALRLHTINNSHIVTMTHHGMGEFDAVVQTTSFVIRNTTLINYLGMYHRLVDSKNKKNDFLTKKKNFEYCISSRNFLKITGAIISYWLSNTYFSLFDNYLKLEEMYIPGGRNKTHNNEKYVRFWWEVEQKNKWQPYAKGGEYRKWYGNLYYYVDWSSEAKSEYESHGGLYNQKYSDKTGICWSLITSGENSFRVKAANEHYDSGSPTIFKKDFKFEPHVLGYLNSKVTKVLVKILNPTLNLGNTYVLSLPYSEPDYYDKERINTLVQENIVIAKDDWDSFEQSWDFMLHPLIGKGSIANNFYDYKQLADEKFKKLKSNEEVLNKYFINLYNLHGELTPEITDDDISISVPDEFRETRSLISYLIGILLGRFSLSKQGIVYTGGVFDNRAYGGYDVDNDGIIPIYPDISVENGLVHRILGLIKSIYGQDNYRENIEFVAETLGKKNNETSEETINRYLNEDFYLDHLKTFQKKPIYWMFSSGKLNGFKCLVYMHRYNENTLAIMNAGYFQPATSILRNQITQIEKAVLKANDREKSVLERKRLGLVEQLKEAIEYGQVLDYMANKYLSIDLDDGVKVNYAKFQEIEIITSKGKVKKDLLVPIK